MLTIRGRGFVGLVGCCCMAVSVAMPALAKKKSGVSVQAAFQIQIPKEQRIDQALNRLTFGPRSGDADRVRSLGLKKWIDLQLHPDRIPENPLLLDKLKQLDSLSMPSRELVRNYPAPQMVRQMVNGGMPFPSDPDRRMMIQRLVERFERRQQTGQEPPAPDIAGLLTPQQMRL